ncbi:MAG TPA: orotate phosphoribosyltransferase [Calditrichia bacterium]|nr:orotate phosphoribosyltransferase [Calditrichia bacterium]
MTRTELAKQIYRVAHLTGEFLLRSGATSHEYFDKYLFEGRPELLMEIARQMEALIPEEVDALAGLEMGGIPVATLLSQVSGLPTLFVRKEAKSYGTCKLAEGGDIAGRRLVIVEDVVTSGGQILSSVKELREMGAEITDVLCVIDREAGGVEKLAAKGLTLHPLLTMSAIKGAVGA